jgi:hypothetical protein
MKWVLLVLGACGAFTLLVVFAKRWKNIGQRRSPVQPAIEEDLAANHSDTAARRAFHEGLAGNDLDAAIAKFTEAIRLQPDMADAYLERGIAYADRGQLGPAIADFSETIRLQPQLAEAYRGRALAYRSGGQSEKAQTDLQKFDEPSDPAVIRRLFQKDLPEIAEGIVEIKSIARIGGTRTKIAIHGVNPNVDAVRACVGSEMTHIKAIVDELGGERVDLVRWNDSPKRPSASADRGSISVSAAWQGNRLGPGRRAPARNRPVVPKCSTCVPASRLGHRTHDP